jgi:hypothetical protein
VGVLDASPGWIDGERRRGLRRRLNRTYFARVWVMLENWPTASTGKTLVAIRSTGASATVRPPNIVLDVNGKIAGADGTLSGALALNTWHKIELSFSSDGANWTWQVRLNGANVGAAAVVADASTPGGIRIGNNGGTGNWNGAWFDDWAVNDDQGASNNTWPGDGAVVVLVPTADNAVGGDWKRGDASAPGGVAFDSVNNVPPIGVADLAGGAAAAQLRDIVGSQTAPAADADFTMRTYLAAGVGATDPIIATQVRAAISSNGVTSRNMAVRSVSNPADAAETVRLSGATPAGTYPAGWQNNGCALGPVQDTPAVVRGTSPVARVAKRTTNVAAMMCCALQIHVEYQPPAAVVATGQLYPHGKQGASPATGQLFPRGIRAA